MLQHKNLEARNAESKTDNIKSEVQMTWRYNVRLVISFRLEGEYDRHFAIKCSVSSNRISRPAEREDSNPRVE